MGKTVATVVGVVAAVVIAVAAPYLAPIALTALGITATATAVAIATAIIGATLAIGVSLAFKALGVGAVPSAKVTGTPQVFRQSITDSFIAYGERRLGGLLVFFHPRVSGSDHYRYFVIACAGHRCKGAVTFKLNDEDVTVDAGTGLVTSGKYANAAWLWFKRGTETDIANATLVAECGGKWTADHKGLGIAALEAKFKMTDAVVAAGMPNMTVVAEGRDEILDTRDGVAKYTRNGVLIIYDWMRLPREEGGFGAYADEIPDDDWISAQANVCDETVNGNPRYALDAVLTTGSPPGEVRDAFIVNVAGRYTYSGGKHLIRPGYWVPVSITLDEKDLAGGIRVSPFLPPDMAATEVQGTYINPDDGYQGAPFTTKSSGAVDVLQIDLDLAFTSVLDQANRVATIMLNRALAEKSIVWPMNCVGIGVNALDTVQVHIGADPDGNYGLNNYAWWVASWGLSADYGVVLKLQEESAAIYAEPVPIAPVAVGTIDKASTVLTVAEISALITNSSPLNPDATTPVLTASSTAIFVKNHARQYSDKTVTVDGNTSGQVLDEDMQPILDEAGDPILDESGSTAGGVAPAATGKLNHVGYVDADRAGGAVVYVVSTNLYDVTNSGAGGANPFMHYLGSVDVPSAGSSASNSGNVAAPPGYYPPPSGGGALP
jgi:hypothetical protein